MEEALRKELHQIWLKKHNGEITKEECKQRNKDLIYKVLEENPQKLLDLCVGHISGLSDENLLEKAKNETDDFVFMNISCGSYHYEDIVKEPPNPDSRKIKKIYRNILGVLGLNNEDISKILNKTSNYDYYNSEPAETMLDVLTDENICACIDWKFGLEDVEYNLNLITKRLNMEPIREYPPYQEGQPLGNEALETIIKESIYAAVIICDGDSTYIFLTSEESVQSLKEEIDKLNEFWILEDVFVIS